MTFTISRFRTRSVLHATVITLVLSCASSCALTRPDHMATTNWVDRHIVPDNRAAQFLMTPILIPICLLTLTIDNFIIAPIVHLPSAADDTRDFWNIRPKGYYTALGLGPFQALATPFVFVGSWFGRTFFAAEVAESSPWNWPEWGRRWRRDDEGRLIGPPEDSMTKEPETAEPPDKNPRREPQPNSGKKP